MRKLLRAQFVRFLFVGGLNTAFSYVIYANFLYIGFDYILANFGAMVLGVLFSFRTQGALVFNNRNSRLIYRFAMFWLIMFFFNTGVISLLMRFGLNSYVSGALALVPTAIVSFFVQKLWVFKTSQPLDTGGASES